MERQPSGKVSLSRPSWLNAALVAGRPSESVNRDMSDGLFSSESVIVDLQVGSQKQLFQEIALRLISANGLDVSCRDIVAAAVERERLGSTGVGNGVALPHARIEGLDHVVAGFARLTEPMDFDSVDGRPVDLVAFLLAPADAAGAHLRALARVSRQLRREDKRSKLRAAPDALSVFTILSDETLATAAA
jgi:PTS system nitrogen regulatory IIA component